MKLGDTMNLINYINKYGNKTFAEKEINEVDKLLFSLLSYVRYDGAISKMRFRKRTIGTVADSYFSNTTKKEISKNIMAIRTGIDLLNRIRKTKRYKDLLMYSDVYIGDDKQQFSAMCIEINPKLVYVSFEGTDQLISGWEEDCKLTYIFPVLAQEQAIRYLNKNFTLRNCKLIVGGHSKGGNLALTSSMYCNPLVRRKIIEIYSYDGPGLRKKQLESKEYQKVKEKFNHIIPNNSIVGLLLRHDNDYKVIKSNRSGLMAHSALTWQLEDDKFKTAKLSAFSKIIDEGITTWLDKYNDQERERFVNCVFRVFEKTNITSLVQIMANYKLILDIIKEANNIEEFVKDMAKDLVNVLIDCNKEHIKSKFIKE